MKEPIVTRTIKALNVTYLGVNLETHAVETCNTTAPGRIKDKETLMKYLEKVYKNATDKGEFMCKPVEIVNVEPSETLRGMTERTFIENSYLITKNTDKETEEDQN